MIDHPDEASFDSTLLARFREIRYREPGETLEEVDEILRRHDAAE